MLPVAPRIVNDVSSVMWLNHDIQFAWQVQRLVKFMCHFSWQVQHLVKFTCYFFVAGAAFGEVHVSLFLAGAACGEIWNDSRSGKRCNFQ